MTSAAWERLKLEDRIRVQCPHCGRWHVVLKRDLTPGPKKVHRVWIACYECSYGCSASRELALLGYDN